MNSNTSHRKTMSYASSHVLWRAAITLELLYGLISENFDKLCPLLESRNGDRPCDTLLSFLVEAVTDFSVVVSSNKIGIISVIEASIMTRRLSEMKDDASYITNEPNVPLKKYAFEIQNIQPLITSRARDIIKVCGESFELSFLSMFTITSSHGKSLMIVSRRVDQ